MLINERTGRPIAMEVEVANTRATRNQGLLGREGLVESHAIVLSPCFSIHTAFMRFPIDVLFVDRDGCAIRIVPALGPWRRAGAMRARHVVEMAAGELCCATASESARLPATDTGYRAKWTIACGRRRRRSA